jgi:hypothetical protein
VRQKRVVENSFHEALIGEPHHEKDLPVKSKGFLEEFSSPLADRCDGRKITKCNPLSLSCGSHEQLLGLQKYISAPL